LPRGAPRSPERTGGGGRQRHEVDGTLDIDAGIEIAIEAELDIDDDAEDELPRRNADFPLSERHCREKG
jgi:hypothetical protein